MDQGEKYIYIYTDTHVYAATAKNYLSTDLQIPKYIYIYIYNLPEKSH